METKPKHSQIAANYFKKGYNCAQSVFLTYAKDFGIDETMALKMSSSFGGGMGRLREVCGAVSAMFMVAGLAKGYTEPNNDIVKAEHYQRIQELAQQFKEKHSTIICRELLGETDGKDSSFVPSKRTAEYYTKRPCEQFIKDACEILDEKIMV